MWDDDRRAVRKYLKKKWKKHVRDTDSVENNRDSVRREAKKILQVCLMIMT